MIETTQLEEKGLGNKGKYVYTADDIFVMLQVSRREAYHILNTTSDYKVIKFGRNIRADRASFDKWFHGDNENGPICTYTPGQVAEILMVSEKTARRKLMAETDFRVLKCGKQIIRAHKGSFDKWLGLISS